MENVQVLFVLNEEGKITKNVMKEIPVGISNENLLKKCCVMFRKGEIETSKIVFKNGKELKKVSQ